MLSGVLLVFLSSSAHAHQKAFSVLCGVFLSVHFVAVTVHKGHKHKRIVVTTQSFSFGAFWIL